MAGTALWMIVFVVIAAGSLGLAVAIRRLGQELPPALAAIDTFRRDLRPALVRVRTETAATRARIPRSGS
jgi:hypothetical protein